MYFMAVCVIICVSYDSQLSPDSHPYSKMYEIGRTLLSLVPIIVIEIMYHHN